VSQVFVSCAYRDRAVGQRVSGLLHRLGDEPVDDRNDAEGTAWWNEVVGRIETCEVFVAVVSPAYADAHACRLAAKHAAATGLPVVRLDLGDKPPTSGLHPVVRTAEPVRFDPDDPGALAVLDRALDTALDTSLETATDPTVAPNEPAAAGPRQEVAAPPPPPSASPPPAPSVPPSGPPPVPPPVSAGPTSAGGPEATLTGHEVVLAAVMVVLALALVLVVGRAVLHLAGIGDERTPDESGRVLGVTTGAEGTSDAASSAATAGAAENATGGPNPSPKALSRQVLALVAAADSEDLPASSCAAGDDHVTCREAAPNLQAVVLTPYSSQTALYDAYDDAVRALSGDSAPENVGDCSGKMFDGELSWNLNFGHRYDISAADQTAGGLDPASEAAGRIFCTESSDVIKLVWTQDPGLLITATGQPANLTIGWWHGVHVDLACAAGMTGTACSGEEG
jgi:hypothetical protein